MSLPPGRVIEDDPSAKPAGNHVSPFAGRGGLTAWGFDNGTLHAETLIPRLASCGFRWLATETGTGNDPHVPELCAEHGLKHGVWEANTVPGDWAEVATTIRDWQADFYIATVEGPHDPSFPTNVRGIMGEHYPLALVTNFGGLDTVEECSTWIQAGFECLTECYLSDCPNCTPANMAWEALRRGFPRSYPCVGIYGGKTVADYLPLDSFSLYVLEYLDEAGWATLA